MEWVCGIRVHLSRSFHILSGSDPSAKTRTAIVEFGAEFLGTFIILFFGCAAGGAMQTGAVVGAWQAGIIWGIGVVAAIFASGN